MHFYCAVHTHSVKKIKGATDKKVKNDKYEQTLSNCNYEGLHIERNPVRK